VTRLAPTSSMADIMTVEEKIMKLNIAIATVLVVPALAVAASPAVAAPAQHDVFVEEYDEYLPFPAGEGPCVDWAGTLHEVRSGQFKVLTPGGARHPDEFHANGVVDGLIELIPDDPTLPSYSGAFRQKANVIGTVTEEGDDLRIAQYRVRSVLTGTDGSRLTLSLAGKVTVNGRGDLVVDRFEFSCG
jgi:hypothetical protein